MSKAAVTVFAAEPALTRSSCTPIVLRRRLAGFPRTERRTACRSRRRRRFALGDFVQLLGHRERARLSDEGLDDFFRCRRAAAGRFRFGSSSAAGSVSPPADSRFPLRWSNSTSCCCCRRRRPPGRGQGRKQGAQGSRFSSTSLTTSLSSVVSGRAPKRRPCRFVVPLYERGRVISEFHVCIQFGETDTSDCVIHKMCIQWPEYCSFPRLSYFSYGERRTIDCRRSFFAWNLRLRRRGGALPGARRARL